MRPLGTGLPTLRGCLRMSSKGSDSQCQVVVGDTGSVAGAGR